MTCTIKTVNGKRGDSIGDLNDVHLTLPVRNYDHLEYNTTTGRWENVSNLTLDGYMDFLTGVTPSTEPEGRLWWNGTDHCMNLSSGLGPVLQSGQESWLPFTLGKNDTRSEIPNGTAVYLCVSGGQVCISPTNSSNPDIVEKTVGITTEAIPDGETGIVTTYGLVRGVDTQSWSVGDTLYVSPTVDGGLTSTRPTDGDWPIPLCEVITSAADGVLMVKYLQIFDPDDIKNSTGFPNQNAAVKQSDVSFTNSSPDRTLSIAPNTAGGYDSFYIWQLGVKYVFDEAQTVQIPDEEGSFYVYFDDGVLTYIKNPNDGQAGTLIRLKTLVAIVYWNSDDKEAVIIGDERHGFDMSGDTHAYIHFTDGAQWLSGLALSNILTVQDDGADGDNDDHAQFDVESGVVTDEDLINIISSAYRDDIIAVDTGADTFTVAGDKTSVYTAGKQVRASEAGTSNGEYYTVVSSTYTTSTLIEVAEEIGSADTDWYLSSGLPIFYLDGASLNLRRTVEPGFSVLTSNPGVANSGRLVYNDTSTGTLVEITNNDFVLCHVFATNSKQDPLIVFVGQADYATRSQARAGAESEISTIITNYPSPELVPLGTIIYQTGNLYTNAVKARINTTEDDETYVDWRTSEVSPGATPSSHSNLSSLLWTGSGHNGTNNVFAGFNGSGLATEYTESNYLLTDGTRDVESTLTIGSGLVDAASELFIDHSDSRVGNIKYLQDGSLRWVLRQYSDAEGSDFEFRRHNTSGVFQDIPIAIDFATGDVTVVNDFLVDGTLYANDDMEITSLLTANGGIDTSGGDIDCGSGTVDAYGVYADAEMGIGTGSPDYDLHISKVSNGPAMSMSHSSNTTGQFTGTRYKISSVTGNTYYKGGIFYERTTSLGRGSFHVCCDAAADSGNAVIGDSVMEIGYGGVVVITGLPTSDPSNTGQLWNDSGTLKVSA